MTPPFAAILRDRLVGLAAWVAWHQRTAVGMRDEDRTLAGLEGIERRAVAAMRHVNRHPCPVHSLDDRHAEVGESLVAPLSGAVADQIPARCR